MCYKKCKTLLMCLFRVGCFMLSFGAVVWNIYLFRLDEDSVEIKVKEMPSKDYVFYSSITLCFRRQINNWNKVFIGHHSSKDQLQDKSDRRIFHIDDYIDNIVLKYKNENRERITKTVSNITPYEEDQYTGHFRKVLLRRFQSSDCVDINIPVKKRKNIHSINIAIKDDVFRPKGPSTVIENKIEIGVTVHNSIFMLPNTFLIPKKKSNRPELDSHQKLDCSGITFYIKEIDILRRRNKPTNPCINSHKNGALSIIEYAARRIQCVPNGWEIPHVLPNCKDKKLHENATVTLNKVQAALEYFLYKSNPKFCKSIRNVQIQYDSRDSIATCTENMNTTNITVIYDSYSLTETRLVRSYTVTNLLFNIGYIISLFLGLSLIQLPVIFTKLISTMCRKLQALRTKKESDLLSNGHIPHQATDVRMPKNVEECHINQTLANQEILNLRNHIMQLRALVLLQGREYDTVL